MSAPYVEQPRAIANGQTYPGARLYFYASGTSDPLVAIYADQDLTTQLQNPLIADAAARWQAIYLDADAHAEYRARCISSDGNTLVFDEDPINPLASPYSRPGPALNASGSPLAFATLGFFSQSTTDPRTIYADESLSEEIPNPQTADAQGVFAEVWMDNNAYRVIQKNQAGELIYDIGFWRGVPSQGPQAPVLSGVTVGTDNQLSWIAATPGSFPISEYVLERSADEIDWDGIATVVATDPLEYTDSVDSQSIWFYRVRAFDVNGDASAYSNVVELEADQVDPYFDNIVVLLTADTGAMVEWSGFPSVSVVGGGVVSTAQVKFGIASFRNPGTNSESDNYVRIEDTTASQGLFIFPDVFTIEGWFYVVGYNTNAYENLFSSSVSFPANGFIQLAIANSGASHKLLWNSKPGTGVLSSSNIPLNQWIHMAVTRDDDDLLTIWHNGTAAGSATISGVIGALNPSKSSLDCCRGIALDNSDADCFFDQIRITKACRYTTDFSPPITPFPKT